MKLRPLSETPNSPQPDGCCRTCQWAEPAPEWAGPPEFLRAFPYACKAFPPQFQQIPTKGPIEEPTLTIAGRPQPPRSMQINIVEVPKLVQPTSYCSFYEPREENPPEITQVNKPTPHDEPN